MKTKLVVTFDVNGVGQAMDIQSALLQFVNRANQLGEAMISDQISIEMTRILAMAFSKGIATIDATNIQKSKGERG